jgi:hypothetical protein
MLKNKACAGSATGKPSSRHPLQDWSDDDSDDACLMFLNPIALAFAFLASSMSGIPDEEVIRLRRIYNF